MGVGAVALSRNAKPAIVPLEDRRRRKEAAGWPLEDIMLADLVEESAAPLPEFSAIIVEKDRHSLLPCSLLACLLACLGRIC